MIIGTTLDTFAGRTVAPFDLTAGLGDVRDIAIRVEMCESRRPSGRSGSKYVTVPIEEVIARLAADPKAGEVEALVTGIWSFEAYELGPDPVVDALIEAASSLPNLEALFVNDLTYEVAELSWIQNTDLAPLVHAFGGLKVFGTRGGEGLRLKNLRHDTLEHLIIEAGGLSTECVRDVTRAHLPSLRRLDLWLGTGEYGGTATVEDLTPLLSGKLFPSLEVLGLQNCDFANAVAHAISTAPILERLAVLDLSMGTLNDRGASAFLASPAAAKLKRLDLSENYVSPELGERLQEALPGVQVEVESEKWFDFDPESDVEDDDEDGYSERYVTHGE